MTDDEKAQLRHRLVLKRALERLKRLRVAWAEYEEACRQDRREGHIPHYCFHGTNLWVDYDPICGPCEDGVTLHQMALASARQDVDTFMERMEVVSGIHRTNAPIPGDLFGPLMEWACQTITPDAA